MKSFPVYLCLVGVPLAGLAMILRAGDGLTAPPPIAGAWRVEGQAALAAAESARTFAISQSGQHVEVAFGGHSMRGRFSGDSLVAEGDASARGAPGPCGPSTGLRLRARVDTAARPLRLAGVLDADAPGCAPAALIAVRSAAGVR
jgi:hypothetical protein